MSKKLLIVTTSIYLLTAWVNLAFAQTSGYDYATKAGVSDQIKQYLCAPSDPNPASTNLTGSQLQYSGANNTASGDLYNCINRLYRFAIVMAAVVGVFFIVIAGYLYMSASGSQESVDKAKNILTTTITSLIILFAGYILLKAINPDLIKFRSIQPPSVQLNIAYTPGSIYTGGIGGTGTGSGSYVIAGYNIGAYATASNHEAVVATVYNGLANVDFSTSASVDLYLKRIRANTPITGAMVLASAQKYGVDAKLVVALMQVDSSLGTAGKGANTHNPGNVGNNDAGQTIDWGTWEKGVDAVAEWLSKHRA